MKPKTAKHKGRTDEELFGNTNDIFGDIPAAKPKATKKKKKAVTATDDKGKEDVDGTVTTGGAEKVDESQGTTLVKVTHTLFECLHLSTFPTRRNK